MKKAASTKKALLLSVLSTLLCVSMLIGTTFAWFTDTASTAVNAIKSGTLDVALEMKNADGEWVNAEGETLNFVAKDGNTEILWEPGCTYELPELRVVNKGNLSLKYKVVITGINGSARLNEVIDWTINGADTGVEYHLAALAVSDSLTISGHMSETAGNEYQDLTIDGIGITVYAVQDTGESDSNGNDYDKDADGTPGFDTWNDAIAATGTVTAGETTVIKDKETDSTITITIPANSTTAEKATLVREKAEAPANITVELGTNAVTANVTLLDENGNKITAENGKFFTLTMQQAKGANVIGFYHNGVAMTAVASAEEVAATNDTYYYDATTGVVTFSTDDFSPFTAVISDSDYNGGLGTAEAPYLIATGEQAYLMRNGKGYFKLVADVVVTNEIYLSGKTVVVDLNGHSIRLEYAADAKPNNGGVFNISGKNSKLTINDSSAEQTGAVIGSNQSYANKVTSAVRVGNYGKLTINGGHFYGTSEGTSCIFVMTSRSSGSKATVTINGGIFETATPNTDGTYYVLNHQDSATTGCTITVNGGSFKNYNPGVTAVDPVNAYTGKITLGKDRGTVVSTEGNDTWYTVKPLVIADSLEDAFTGIDFGYNNPATGDIVLDGEGLTFITKWTDAYITSNTTIKGVTFVNGATFTTKSSNITFKVENCTFYACDQSKLEYTGNNSTTNSGAGMCLNLEQKGGTSGVDFAVLNCTFVGENDNTLPVYGNKYNGDGSVADAYKKRGHAIALNAISGGGTAGELGSLLIEGCTMSGVRGNAIQLYGTTGDITIKDTKINSWGMNSGAYTNAKGELKDANSAAIRGDFTVGGSRTLTITNVTFGMNENQEEGHAISHVNVGNYPGNTDGTRTAGTY